MVRRCLVQGCFSNCLTCRAQEKFPTSTVPLRQVNECTVSQRRCGIRCMASRRCRRDSLGSDDDIGLVSSYVGLIRRLYHYICSQVYKKCPYQWKNVISACCILDPTKRPSAADVLKTLEAMAEELGGITQHPGLA